MANPILGLLHALSDRLSKLEQKVQALATQPVLQHASAMQSDGTVGLKIDRGPSGTTETIWYYGPGLPGGYTPQDGFWPGFMYLGQLTSPPGSGNHVGTGLITYRPDGSESMVIGNEGVGLLNPYGQQVLTTDTDNRGRINGYRPDGTLASQIGGAANGFYDRAGNLLLGSDDTSGQGLARPWLPLPIPVDVNTANWPGTSATTWTNVSNANTLLQHPKVWFEAQGWAPAGVTGQFQFWFNGVPVGSVWSATGGYTTTNQTFALPAGWTFGGNGSLQIYAQVTAGSGTVRCQVTQIYGIQS